VGYIMLKKISVILIFISIFIACSPEPVKKGKGKFGMLSSDNPEFAAISFFEHIYHSKVLEGAIELSTPKMERLIRSYHTNKSVQKHVLNMRFDKVTIKPSTNSAGRNKFAKNVTISFIFKGELHGDIVKDMRVVKLIRIDTNWKVDEVSFK
jgi:hypothetical protein